MKLKVYQQGGGLIYTPFIPGQSIAASGSSSNSSDSEDAKIDPLDKVLMDLMKDQNLLPSDIDAIYRNLIKFQKSTQYLSSSDGYRSVMPGMLKIMNMTSVAKTNKEQWDNSLSEIRKHDAGSEVAMDSYGRIWVSDGSDIKKIELSEFDPSKYSPLSNSQLLYMRQRNPQLGFSDMFDDTWTDIVGMDDVRAEIYNIIDNFGSIKSPKYQKQSMKDIASDLKGDGIFKITEKYSKADLNDFSGLLYNQLSREAKNLINANAKIGGFSTEDFIRSIISSQTDIDIDSSYESSLTKANGLGGEGGSGSDGSDSLTKDTYAERLANGQVEPYSWTMIETKNNGNQLYAVTQNYGVALHEGNPIGVVNLNQFLQNFDASGIIDWQHITFGDQPISTIDLQKVVYDGTSSIQRVELPVKQDGSVDFEAQQELSNLQDWIDENGVISDAVIEQRIKEIPNAKWNKDKKIVEFDLSKCKPFLVIKGIVSSDKVRINPNSPYIWNMERGQGDPRKDWLELYNSTIVDDDSGKKKGGAMGRHLYEGNIYMPILSSTIGSMLYNDQQVSKSRYMDIRNQSELSNKQTTLKGNYDR